MPRFHLHVKHRNTLVEDEEGEEFASLDSARAAAIQSAREIISDRLIHGQGINGDAFAIADEEGRIVLTVPFSEAIQRD